MKIIAFYLPQFHEIEENNRWWGKGFTEWVNVKKATPLFEGHNQPRVPLEKNYYNLLDDDVKKKQILWAKKYGIYGFCFYHYWFGGHLLLEKPIEQYLVNKDLDFPFCLCWANENWTNAWAANGNKVLIEQKYGDEEEWNRHFQYLLPFFKDSRYIKENGNPLLLLYRPDLIENLKEMLDYWNKLAKENGFERIIFANQNATINELGNNEELFQYHIEYQPNSASKWQRSRKYIFLQNCKKIILKILSNCTGNAKLETITYEKKLEKRNYDKYWKKIIEHIPENSKCVPGAFTDWDNTPRKGMRGSVFIGASPEKFYKYFKELIIHAEQTYKKDYIFIFAWNEWAEGGYLEPDEKNGFKYLEGVYQALKECDELPD